MLAGPKSFEEAFDGIGIDIRHYRGTVTPYKCLSKVERHFDESGIDYRVVDK